MATEHGPLEAGRANRAPLPVIFRGYRDADAPELVALLRRAFGTWPRQGLPEGGEAYVRWKAASHALAPEATVVGELDGRIIACDLAIVNEAWLRGRPVLATNDGDLAVEPDYQGRGVYSQLSHDRIQRTARFDLILQDATPDAVRHVTERKGYRYLANEIEVLAWRTRWPRALRAVERAVVRPGKPNRPAVIAIAASDRRLDGLFEAAAGEFDFIRDRTSRRLSWRYGDPRGGEYCMLGAVDDDRLLGWVAVALRAGHGMLVDALIAPGREEVAPGLFRSAVSLLRRHGARRIRCWLPGHHPYRSALKAAGLSGSGRIVPLQYMARRLSDEDVAVLADPGAAIHVMLGDSDVA